MSSCQGMEFSPGWTQTKIFPKHNQANPLRREQKIAFASSTVESQQWAITLKCLSFVLINEPSTHSVNDTLHSVNWIKWNCPLNTKLYVKQICTPVRWSQCLHLRVWPASETFSCWHCLHCLQYSAQPHISHSHCRMSNEWPIFWFYCQLLVSFYRFKSGPEQKVTRKKTYFLLTFPSLLN